MKIILIVANDDAQGWLIAHIISRERPYRAILARGCSEALYFVKHIMPHLFILDYRLPAGDSIECYDCLRTISRLKNIPAILVGADFEQVEQEVKTCNFLIIWPPFEMDELLDTIDKLVA